MTSHSDQERAYQHLRRGIVEGDYAPGSRVVEQRVAEASQCSRTPVREAVRRLEAEGLVIVEPNRGARVRPLTESVIVDLYGARARLEGYVAGLAAERHDHAELLDLRGALDAFDEAATAAVQPRARMAAVRRLEQTNAAFHDLVIVMSRHQRAAALVAATVDAPLVFQAFRQFGAAELQRSVTFHHLVADAIAAREADRAERLMVEHVLQGRDSLLEHLAGGRDISDIFGSTGA